MICTMNANDEKTYGNIINVPTNLNIVQIVLPRIPHEDYLIYVFLERKFIYICMVGYVQPNISL